VVAEDAGVKALQVVHAGFGLAGEERHTAQGTASPHDPD
jgi:aspartate kinase